jgi:hypothetical protein
MGRVSVVILHPFGHLIRDAAIELMTLTDRREELEVFPGYAERRVVDAGTKEFDGEGVLPGHDVAEKVTLLRGGEGRPIDRLGSEPAQVEGFRQARLLSSV